MLGHRHPQLALGEKAYNTAGSAGQRDHSGLRRKRSADCASGRVFRYVTGDIDGRAPAAAYAREQGVPDAQIDWP
jgi:hypothetical protein